VSNTDTTGAYRCRVAPAAPSARQKEEGASRDHRQPSRTGHGCARAPVEV